MFSFYCRSAVRIADGFDKAFEYLKSLSAERDAEEVLWQTRRKKVVRFAIPPEYAPGNPPDYQVVWKFYGEKRFFRYLFRPSLAFREWNGYKLAEDCGIPVAKVLAAAENRRGVRLKDSIFVTEFLRCTGDGDDFRCGGCRVQERELAMEFTRKNLLLLVKLHRAGLVHGGFTPRNELYILKPDGSGQPGDRMDVVWIDLATCRKVPWLLRRYLQRKELAVFLEQMDFPPETIAELRQFYLAAMAR